MGEADRTKWDARYSEQAPSEEPSPWLLRWFQLADENMLPQKGRVLDVAGGGGRNGIWFAKRGFEVTVVDVSPIGLEIAEQRAKDAGVTIATQIIDLENESLPEGPWDVILQMHYLERGLFTKYHDALAIPGLLFVEHPTRTNLVRHAKPGAHYLLEDGELPDLCTSFVIVSYGEGWNEAGKHEARIVARKVDYL